MQTPPRVLVIAGSDSGAGAGIQADLKTISALGAYATTAITAITAQNTLRVTAVFELPPEMVAAQIDAIMVDIGTDAVKTGMLANADIIRVVADKIREYNLTNVVVDPVMVAKSGDPLLRPDAVAALRDLLFPLATVVTPNIPEAEALLGEKVIGLDGMRRAAARIRELGPQYVVVKGGHGEGPAIDVLYDGREFREFHGPRINTTSTHGTGCTFASAIAAGLAAGYPVPEAVGRAKEYLTGALRQAFPLGHGKGPVNHFYRFWAAGTARQP